MYHLSLLVAASSPVQIWMVIVRILHTWNENLRCMMYLYMCVFTYVFSLTCMCASVCYFKRHPIIYIKAMFINIILCLPQAHSFQSSQPFLLQTANILHVYITHFISIHAFPFPQQANQKEIQMNLFSFGMTETCLPSNFHSDRWSLCCCCQIYKLNNSLT